MFVNEQTPNSLYEWLKTYGLSFKHGKTLPFHSKFCMLFHEICLHHDPTTQSLGLSMATYTMYYQNVPNATNYSHNPVFLPIAFYPLFLLFFCFSILYFRRNLCPRELIPYESLKGRSARVLHHEYSQRGHQCRSTFR